MTNTYTAWAIRLTGGSLVPAMHGMPGPLLRWTKAGVNDEIRGRKSVGWEPGTAVKVILVVREVVK